MKNAYLLVPFHFGDLNVLADFVASVSPSPSPWHEWLSFLLSSLPNLDDLYASTQHGNMVWEYCFICPCLHVVVHDHKQLVAQILREKGA